MDMAVLVEAQEEILDNIESQVCIFASWIWNSASKYISCLLMKYEPNKTITIKTLAIIISCKA